MNSFNSAVIGTSLIGDIVLVLVLVISFFIGLKKGFIGLIVTFLAGILTFVLATLFCNPVAELIGTTFGLRPVLEQSFSGLFDSEAFTKPLSQLAEEGIAGLFTSLNLPDFITVALKDLLAEKIADSSIPTDVTIQSVLASALAGVALTAIAWVILFALLSIIFFFVKKFVNVFNKIPLIGGLNKLLGGVLSLVICAFILCIVAYLLSLISSSLPEEMVTYIESTKIINWVYNSNPLAQLITSIFVK